MINLPSPSGLGNRIASRFKLSSDRVAIRNLVLGIAVTVSLASAVYWMLLASNRYVSEAHIMVQRTDVSGPSIGTLGGLLGGMTSSGDRTDQMVLRDYLTSQDMLLKLDAELHLRAHFSDWHHDPLSRLWSRDAPIERFHDYFVSRVRIDFNEYTGSLNIQAQAFDPETARAIVRVMCREGERFMNDNVHQLADAQVAFLEGATKRAADRNAEARAAVIAFQNREGIASPEDAVRQVSTIINQLEARRSALQAQQATLESYLVPNHPDVVSVREQISGIEQQIRREKEKVTSGSSASLNRTADRFQRLQQQASFTESLYQNTLGALEKGRIDAMRTIKKVSILQQPTLPERADQPKRLHNSIVTAIIAFVLAGVALLSIAIIRDHID